MCFCRIGRTRPGPWTPLATQGAGVYTSGCSNACSLCAKIPPRNFGTIGWAWYNAIHSGQWLGGYAWCDGCSRASQTAPLALNDPGCRWWPCIVAIDSNDTIPFYCPALAWQRARPWTIHRSRVSIEPGSRTGLCPVCAIAAAHNEEGARSGSILAIEDIRHPEPETEPEIRE